MTATPIAIHIVRTRAPTAGATRVTATVIVQVRMKRRRVSKRLSSWYGGWCRVALDRPAIRIRTPIHIRRRRRTILKLRREKGNAPVQLRSRERRDVAATPRLPSPRTVPMRRHTSRFVLFSGKKRVLNTIGKRGTTETAILRSSSFSVNY